MDSREADLFEDEARSMQQGAVSVAEPEAWTYESEQPFVTPQQLLEMPQGGEATEWEDQLAEEEFVGLEAEAVNAGAFGATPMSEEDFFGAEASPAWELEEGQGGEAEWEDVGEFEDLVGVGAPPSYAFESGFETDRESAPQFEGETTVRRGSRGDAVQRLQQALIRAGAALTADGSFGPATERALMAFQRARGLTPDGVAGQRTWEALNRPGQATGPRPAPPGPAATGQGCPDDRLAQAHGVPLEGSRDGLRSFDAPFTSQGGQAFRDRIRDIAARVNLDPGLLGVNLLAEVQRRGIWMSAGPTESHVVGVDYWHEERPRIRRAVPAATRIRDAVVRDANGQPVHFTNELGKDTGPIYQFRSGQDAMLALASALAYREQRLRQEVTAAAYDRLHPAIRFAAVRLSFNAGLSRGIRFVQQAVAGRDPLVRSGNPGPSRPVRTASIRGGQAIHISQTIFGNVIPCQP